MFWIVNMEGGKKERLTASGLLPRLIVLLLNQGCKHGQLLTEEKENFFCEKACLEEGQWYLISTAPPLDFLVQSG